MESYLLYIQQNALLAFVGIIILSYILEDLAIVTAAILASNQVIPNSLGLIAIFVGIASGDLLLYGLATILFPPNIFPNREYPLQNLLYPM